MYIIQFWDDVLRFIATIKLKETTASDISAAQFLFKAARVVSRLEGPSAKS